MDFLADEVDGLWVGDEGDAHALGGWRLLIAGRFVTTVGEFSAAILERPAPTIATTIAISIAVSIASAVAVARATPAIIGPAIIAAWRAFAGSEIRLGRGVLLASGGASPCWAEREAGQEFAHWIVFGIAHEAHSSG